MNYSEINTDQNSKYIGKEIKFKKGKREYNVVVTKRHNEEYFEVNTKSGKKTFLVKRAALLSLLSI